MIEAVLSVITGRGSPLLAGAWLGVSPPRSCLRRRDDFNAAIAGLVLVVVLP